MHRLRHLIYTYRHVLAFLLLETIALQLVLHKKLATKIILLSITSPFAGRIHEWMYNFRNPINAKLLAENASLHEQLVKRRATDHINAAEEKQEADSYLHKVIPAHVINNSTIYERNYLTLNVGSKDGIRPGMGVFSSQGAIGIIKYVSEHFATAVSLLHVDLSISAKIYPSNAMGTLQWPGKNPSQAKLLYIPPHLAIAVGDSIVTSGYGTAFYEGIPLGIVTHVTTSPSSFSYEITVKLSTDFSSLSYVYIVDYTRSKEQDSLEKSTRARYE
jgi:rod shape-determining protein MreC